MVIQSFRRANVPDWIERCLKSVRDWTAHKGYEYCFYGDEFFDLCGAEYLTRVSGNVRSITNLARLEATKIKLAEGYQRVIWLDADVFVFAPLQFSMDTDAAYAFGHEAWVEANADGSARPCETALHNAAFIFTSRQDDLDLFIHIIRHTVRHRTITSNYQVGVKLISGLAYPLNIETIKGVGMFSPAVLQAIAENNAAFLRQFLAFHGYQMQAANLGLSLNDAVIPYVKLAMDRLEASAGNVVNAPPLSLRSRTKKCLIKLGFPIGRRVRLRP